jgi:D-tyrosyl-tRNA(Tyr) deacylase
MRALLQRVSTASVTVEESVVSQIGSGLLVLLGVQPADSTAEAVLLAEKTVNLRIFADEQGRFHYSLLEHGGAVLVVSQFTLYADMRRGRRPGFTTAAPPAIAEPLVHAYAAALRDAGAHVETGVFGAVMQVALVNEGPATFLLDSQDFKA